jgi:DNA-binding HxlR family transcriptional regulator
MTERNGEAQLRPPEDDGSSAKLTTADVLRLLSAGASGSILMALGGGPLRTMELTERIPGYAPRTIYRYASRLTQIGIIERHEEPGVPSKVVHSLNEQGGRELHDLIDAYANASSGRLPSGEIGAHEWGSLALLADLWESGMFEELNRGPRSTTELARGEHGLSFHQVSRRATLFAIGGFIEEVMEGTRRRGYTLTEKSRRAMGLIAGIGRWRRRHVVPQGMAGLSAGEVAGLMRTVLPLVFLPDHVGEGFELRIVPGGDEREEVVWAKVRANGAVVSCLSSPSNVSSSAQASVTVWVDSVLDGPQKGLSGSAGAPLLAECLQLLHAALWEGSCQAAGSTAVAPAR